jgi:hypothetical protein
MQLPATGLFDVREDLAPVESFISVQFYSPVHLFKHFLFMFCDHPKLAIFLNFCIECCETHLKCLLDLSVFFVKITFFTIFQLLILQSKGLNQ